MLPTMQDSAFAEGTGMPDDAFLRSLLEVQHGAVQPSSLSPPMQLSDAAYHSAAASSGASKSPATGLASQPLHIT